MAGGYLYNDGVPITPSDTEGVGFPDNEIGAMYVGGAGTLKIKTMDGQTRSFPVVAANSFLPVRAKQVFDTDTSATGIIIFRNLVSY